MTDIPGYEEFPLKDGVVRIDRHALEVGVELVDDVQDDLTFVGRACSNEDLDREKALLAYALLDDISDTAVRQGNDSEESIHGINSATDKLRTPLLDILTQDDSEIQLRLFVEWFNRTVAGMHAHEPGILEEFEAFADHMRDRAGVNIARTIYEHDDQLDGLGLDINEEMAKRWDSDEDDETPEELTPSP